VGCAVGCYDAQLSLNEEWIELVCLIPCEAGALNCILLEHLRDLRISTVCCVAQIQGGSLNIGRDPPIACFRA